MRIRAFKKMPVRGFTLLELLIGMFIFSMIMIAIASIFSSSVYGYRGAKNIQQNLENAQYAISYISKTMRTATLIAYTNGSGTTTVVNPDDGSIVPMVSMADAGSVVVWDYSKGQCVRLDFEAASGQLKMQSIGYGSDATLAENLGSCAGEDFSAASASPVINNPVQGNFRVTNSWQDGTGGQMGRVTVSIEVCADTQCLTGGRNKVVAESSVSLRDFNVIGL